MSFKDAFNSLLDQLIDTMTKQAKDYSFFDENGNYKPEVQRLIDNEKA